MTRSVIVLLASVTAATLACGGEAGEEGAIEEAPADTAAADTMAGATAMLPEEVPRFPPAIAQDPCVIVEPELVEQWTGSAVRRLEARLPIVDDQGQARAACVAFPQDPTVSDVPFFEVDLKRPIEITPGVRDAVYGGARVEELPGIGDRAATGDGVAWADVDHTAFELRCERCGERIADALESVVINYEALKE